jgi:hypothetical protein
MRGEVIITAIFKRFVLNVTLILIIILSGVPIPSQTRKVENSVLKRIRRAFKQREISWVELV